ncbi:hypothetical protein OSB04_018976 [Centaurea solstitialis]|uniref:Integrase catalytic domain-containing protein n=1 Tax=Centaurea solstitialis TaxID=347529 RepID=A0AA38SPZ5_9ASTR|nr:hypothetical protein OSB04_018976 [Centaurea solstitialis]
MDRENLKEGLNRVDPMESEEELVERSSIETIPEENHILTNKKGGMPFVPRKKIDTSRKNKGKKKETSRKDNRKEYFTQRTVVDSGTSSQSQNKDQPRGNKSNWNNQWAKSHGVDLSKINKPKPCFICYKRGVSHQNRPTQPKRKFQKKKVEKKSVKMVTKWVPKAVLSDYVASESSGNNCSSIEINTAASSNSNSNTPNVNTVACHAKRKPIIVTKYSSDEIPNKDYPLKLNRLTEVKYVNDIGEPKTILAWVPLRHKLFSLNVQSNQGRSSSLWHVDSGSSWHMTGIMSLLEDFKRFEGGHVAFGGNPKGGKISGKGKVSKGKMTFDDVYFVEQLRYNLLSVSQVCDKKFGLFFTDTECLILAPGFKIDESKVMLRTPRKDNVYCLDIEDASSVSSLNCLFSKASVSESSLWHRRMCHMNFKNTNLLVKNNLVRGFPAKEFSCDDHCVACLKGKKSYCLVIVDDYSRFTWVYFLRTKDETSGLIKPFVIRMENKTNLKNSSTNGVAERSNRTLIEVARTMLADSKLPITFWAEVVNTPCYVQNRVLIVKSKGKTPYELFGRKETLYRIFKTTWVSLHNLDTKTHLGKFESKSDEGYLCSDYRFKYREDSGNKPPFVMFPMPTVDPIDLCTSEDMEPDQEKEAESVERNVEKQTEEGPLTENTVPSLSSEEEPMEPQGSSSSINEPDVNDSNLGVNLPEEPLHLTRTQKNHPPSLVIGDIQSPMITRKQSKVINDPHLGMISVFLSQTEPKKEFDAMKDPSWIEAMQEELLQFVLQHVWDLVDLPKGHRVIGTKWIFRNKTDERGIVIKNKARLVAQGYTQEEWIDYDDVFALVARIEVIRLFLAFASYKGFKVYQMDVKSVFLYSTIDEEMYVSQPPGFEDPKYPDRVYKLRKALYGLHRAPRAWYDTLSSYLLDNQFERGVIDKTLFIKRTKTDVLLVQIYVDDIIFGSTKEEMCKAFEELMHKKFKMSSMGDLTFFLGLQVKQKTDGIFINQSKYVASMLQKYGMSDAKPASTPMETHKHLTADVEGEEVDVHHYRSMIGSFMYLTASRPNIMFVVCVCAWYQVRPKESHLQAVKRIFKYLKGQPRLGLWYPNDSPFDLVAYTDSDYGGANLDRKSTSGGCQFLGARLVSWQCKKQTTVSQSTTEAEYIAASHYCSQVLWIQNQMLDCHSSSQSSSQQTDARSDLFCSVRDLSQQSAASQHSVSSSITMDSDDEIQYERDWDTTKRLEREKASLTTQLAKAVAQFKEKELHWKNHIKEQELQMKNQIKEKDLQMKNQIKEKELDFEKQIAETKLQCKKQIKESSKIIQFLDEKLHKIGVSERTIFLNKPSALRDFLDVKWGLGYENPNVLKKALKEKSAFYDFSSMLMSTRFPSLKGFEMKEDFSDMQEFEQHDPVYYEPKYHRVKFVYNSDTLRIKSKDSSNSSDFLVYPDISSSQESDIETKPYVPTLALEEKIADLENLLKTTQSEYESLRIKEKTEHNAEREMLLEQIQILQQVVYESEHDLKNERNRFAKDREEYVQEILELQRIVADLQKLLEDKAGREKQNVELEFANERHKFETDIEQLTKTVFDLQHTLIDERKVFDLKSETLSKKISELEKKIILDKKNALKKPSLRVGKYQNLMHEFEEEIQVVHSERKVGDKKSIELQKQIVDLQNQLSDIIAEPKKPTLLETDFEAQKEAFKTEMRKLTSKLSGLSTDIMNEQRMRSDEQKKINDLLEERNKLSSKVKELEKTIFKAHDSSYVDSTSRSNINSSGQIRTSNLFYDRRVDYSGNHRFSNSKFVWQVKGSNAKDIEVSMINPEPEDLPKKHNPRLDLVCEGVIETPIYIDNNSAISIVNNPVKHSKTKHIEGAFNKFVCVLDSLSSHQHGQEYVVKLPLLILELLFLAVLLPLSIVSIASLYYCYFCPLILLLTVTIANLLSLSIAYHNKVGYLTKDKHSNGFEAIVDFLASSSIAYVATLKRTIYVNHMKDFWANATIEESEGVKSIHTTICGQSLTVTPQKIRQHLHFNDEGDVPTDGDTNESSTLNSKVFSNMKRPAKGSNDTFTPLFSTMIGVNPTEGEASGLQPSQSSIPTDDLPPPSSTNVPQSFDYSTPTPSLKQFIRKNRGAPFSSGSKPSGGALST